jgi:hypothetical protein
MHSIPTASGGGPITSGGGPGAPNHLAQALEATDREARMSLR